VSQCHIKKKYLYVEKITEAGLSHGSCLVHEMNSLTPDEFGHPKPSPVNGAN
jgi:hypothetical protein